MAYTGDVEWNQPSPEELKMTKLSANKQMILDFVQKTPNLSPSEIGGRLAPEGTKNANGWGRDNVRSMVGTGHLEIKEDGTVAVAPSWKAASESDIIADIQSFVGEVMDAPFNEEVFGKGVPYVGVDELEPTGGMLASFRKKLAGLFGVEEDGPEVSGIIATIEHESGTLTPEALQQFNNKSLDGIVKGDFQKTAKSFGERMADVSESLREFGRTMTRQNFNFRKPEAELTVKRERDLQLQAVRRMPKLLRQIPKKGTSHRRILVEFKSEVDKRVHRYHATKGWRSSAA
ncbi:hypothetical protein LOKG_00067 [Loktanella phage pCB2051-A]|uniref:Uncharacterized protein n=1 Tax=Loktanella phage pCB2051-A TaxID=754044 RepID=M4QRN9_9CAUD|nr:hypothetical protein LOKG_00067 [Loktanella phage pCB2051-A]AGH31503.1 hypothetical protein LOKG_00067 [Loktanella phage pCB2051-A]